MLFSDRILGMLEDYLLLDYLVYAFAWMENAEVVTGGIPIDPTVFLSDTFEAVV